MTNWPPIFATVSEWTECPKVCSLEERAAWTVLEVRDLNRGDFAPEDASLSADAEVVLRELRAVAPKVEADPELAEFSKQMGGYTIAMIFRGSWFWMTADEARKRYAALGAVLQEADDAKSN